MPSPEPGIMRRATRDGVTLAYREATGLGQPIVLVHGWCCDHTYLAPQFEHFRQLGHRVISVDLRGHGASDKPCQAYPIASFVDDLAWLCSALELNRPILIGHSMGGTASFELAGRYPKIPAAVAILDAAVAVPAAARPAMSVLIESLKGAGYHDALREFVARAFFIPTDDSVQLQRILREMSATPRHVAVAAFEGIRDYDPSEAASSIVAPILYVTANESPPRSDVERLHQLIPDASFGQTVGSGHFCQLEVPGQINAMLDRFIAIATSRRQISTSVTTSEAHQPRTVTATNITEWRTPC